jgi:hypothetical protein
MDPSELNTWSCIPSSNFQNLQIEITSSISGGFGSVQLVSTDGSLSLQYGAQAPIFNVSEDVQMAIDVNDLGRGPAYFFYLTYDKVVILHETELTPSLPSQYPSKRGISQDYERRDLDNDLTSVGDDDSPINAPYQGSSLDMSRKTKPGDMIWVCVWNNTLLEGFIFITQKSGNASLGPSTTLATTPTPTSPTLSPNSMLMPYPYIFKIEERRIPASQTQPEPYCQMMRINEDGYSTEPVKNSTGGMIIDTLDEYKPWTKSRRRLAKRGLSLSRLGGRDDGYPTCRCEWMSS